MTSTAVVFGTSVVSSVLISRYGRWPSLETDKYAIAATVASFGLGFCVSALLGALFSATGGKSRSSNIWNKEFCSVFLPSSCVIAAIFVPIGFAFDRIFT